MASASAIDRSVASSSVGVAYTRIRADAFVRSLVEAHPHLAGSKAHLEAGDHGQEEPGDQWQDGVEGHGVGVVAVARYQFKCVCRWRRISD
jgi:hypothetical protein